MTGNSWFRSINLYNFTKSLEGDDILTFPEGTHRSAVKITLELCPLERNKKPRIIEESEFNDYELL